MLGAFIREDIKIVVAKPANIYIKIKGIRKFMLEEENKEMFKEKKFFVSLIVGSQIINNKSIKPNAYIEIVMVSLGTIEDR